MDNNILTEGRYDALTRRVVNDIMTVVKQSKSWQKVGKFGEGETVMSDLPEDVMDETHPYYEQGDLYFSVEVMVDRIPDLDDGTRPRDFIVLSYRVTEEQVLEFHIILDPDKEPQSYEKLFYKLNEDVRHEMEHLLQYGPSRIKDRPKGGRDTVSIETTHKHHLSPDEIEALVYGFYRRAKIEKRPLDEIMIEDLDNEIEQENMTKVEAEEILNVWLAFARRRLPDAVYTED